MTFEIEIQSGPAFLEWRAPVARAAEAVLDQSDLKECAITIVLTEEHELRRINREYAGDDHATDVLSFPSGEIDPGTGVAYLGDVLIAVPFAQRQADNRGHSLIAELSLLTIHGTLHLLGYDHLRLEDKLRMWAKQAQILESLGFRDISTEVD